MNNEKGVARAMVYAAVVVFFVVYFYHANPFKGKKKLKLMRQIISIFSVMNASTSKSKSQAYDDSKNNQMHTHYVVLSKRNPM